MISFRFILNPTYSLDVYILLESSLPNFQRRKKKKACLFFFWKGKRRQFQALGFISPCVQYHRHLLDMDDIATGHKSGSRDPLPNPGVRSSHLLPR